jgi:hypothetical protein
MTYVEAMLIAAVHVVMSCFTLKAKGGKGQLGYSGHCVALPRDTARLVNAIPMLPADLEVIIVRPADADDDELATKSTLLQRWRSRPPTCLPELSLYDVRVRV